ncbi:HlyD family type I secretion periplasmic adaptor subunit [Comamonas testosteroni]|uniref:HlyD family type I secretion periplasmic adaptor subunit n=1 Tax=Comamonas testosteroni TaxID=285 RepID=UPI00265DD29E|nr:HlyD family type I secretion periplasmic adaptor subunit [Comamonas testosteroni]WKL15906.1 HlyD family type I secretion periplasmic adaptor subunit [Comamonas testosteroni]
MSTPQAAATATQAAAPRRHPVLELLARYRAIFGMAWTHRHELAGPQRLADEAAFLPAALSLQETPVHPAPRRLAWGIVALFFIALIWSIVGQVDIVAVAPGRIIVSERTKVVQPLERSVVQRILVRDGDHVQAGQALVELDPTSAHADKTSVQEALKVSQADVLRSRILLNLLAKQDLSAFAVSAQSPHLTAESVPVNWTTDDTQSAQTQLAVEWSDIAARLGKAQAEILRRQAEASTVRELIAKLEATLPIARQREADFKTLAAQGDISQHATQDRSRERIEMERDLATQRARLQETIAAQRESENTRAAYLAETRKALRQREAEADLKRNQASQEHSKAVQREKLTTLKAPVTGTVQQLAVHTEGGVVTEAQPLLVIVPDEASVTAEVMLENKDIGFVRPGQEAEIKLETFLYTRYGTVPATVKTVTADAINDEKKGAIFPVMLTLSLSAINVDGRPIKLGPGMNLTAEIKTGRRKVIEYLLSPIQETTHESLRER